jgi:hypothetical protein
VRIVTGSESDYIPSTFVAFDAAVAEGRAVLAVRPESLGASAHANINPARENARIHIVQGQDGYPAILTMY